MPLRKRGDIIFYDGVEAARGMMFPIITTDLPLEVVPSPVVSCFFGAMASWRGFLRICLVGEKFECWDSALNESTNLQCRFSYASDRTVDLTPQAEKEV